MNTRHLKKHKLRTTDYKPKEVRAVHKASALCTSLFVCATLRKIDVHHRNEQRMAHYSNPNQIVWEKILKYNENNRKMLKDVQQK